MELLFCVNLILILFVVYKPMQNPEEIIENERAIKYKLIELQNMAIYWDTDVTLVGDLPSKDLEASSNSSTYTYSKCTYSVLWGGIDRVMTFLDLDK